MRFTREQIPWSWSIVFSWGGLRGALPSVLSIPRDVPFLELLVTMTFKVAFSRASFMGLAYHHFSVG